MAVIVDRVDDVVTLTINRPDARNALNAEVLDGLTRGLNDADEDSGVRVVVLTGAGERVFCAGADLASGMLSEAGAVEQHEQRGMLRDFLAAAERLGKPLVGRLNGHALAGGFGLALACDLLVACDDVQLGTPEVRVGLWPYMISALLVEHLGPKRALELMMTGERIPAAQAQEWGLLNRVCARESLDETVDEVVASLRRAGPVALRLGRRSYYESREMTPHAALAYLHGMLDLTVQTEDVVEGVTAFFQKRDPDWKHR